MDNYYIIIFFSFLVVLSYLYAYLNKLTKIPSVIFLVATGVLVRYVASSYIDSVINLDSYIEILGVIGLIMIVLEASLDLEIKKENRPIIRHAFFSSISLFMLPCMIIGYIFVEYYEVSIRTALIYAIPLSIVSSTILVPSIEALSKQKKEFLIYESSFADIIGVVVFNMVLANESVTVGLFTGFAVDLVVCILISLVASVGLMYLLARTKNGAKFFLTFSVLILLYSVGKKLHMPSLLLIVIFGIYLKNFEKIRGLKFFKWIKTDSEIVSKMTDNLHMMTQETSFLIRTFFFILFGFSMNLEYLANWDVAIIGGIITAILILTRLFILKQIRSSDLFPALFLFPRGLITVLLFYKIPEEFKIPNFQDGILYFVIIISNIIMTVALMLDKDTRQDFEQNKHL